MSTAIEWTDETCNSMSDMFHDDIPEPAENGEAESSVASPQGLDPFSVHGSVLRRAA